MSEEKQKYAVIDVLDGDYNEFDDLQRARNYASDLACGKDLPYEIKTVSVCDEWSSADLLPNER